MIGRIPRIFINNLLSKIDIINFISTKILLKKKGKNYYACCPFHDEKIPSFVVNNSKQFYYCFGCGAHGNVIDFLMNYDNLNFVETIEELAVTHGLEISYESINNLNKIDKYLYQDLYKLMNDISKFYQYFLNKKDSKNARYYLKQRGLSNDIIYRFSIGFSPKGWNNLLQYFSKNTYNYKQLDIIGMLVRNNNGYVYDRFRERIMFPIRDYKGRIIAFGSRVLDDTLPKYLNSPETKIFRKSYQLYGLYEAIQFKLSPSKLLVVEGYMDVITLAQFGINYAVASLGTSITLEHIRLLFRNTDTIICCYDGDKAGRQAAWRMLKLSLSYLIDGRQLKFIFLPENEDPDSLIRKEGKINFEERINKSDSLSTFLFDMLVMQVDLSSYEGKLKLSNLAITLIKKIPSYILQLYLIKKLGNFIGIPDTYYIISIIQKKLIKKMNYKVPIIKPTTIRILIALLVQNPYFVNLITINFNKIKNFKLPGLILFLDLIKICKFYPNINTGQLLEYYRDNRYIKQLSKLASWNYIDTEEIAKKTFKDALLHLFIIAVNKRFENLMIKERIKGLTNEERKEVYLIINLKNNILKNKNI